MRETLKAKEAKEKGKEAEPEAEPAKPEYEELLESIKKELVKLNKK